MSSLQAIQIAFGALDTKTDPARLAPGGMTLLENLSAQVNGIYEKRHGYDALSMTQGPTTILRLASRQDELLAADDNTLYTYSPTRARWASRGPLPSTITSQASVALDQSTDIVQATRASTTNGYVVHAWIDGNGAVTAMVIDNANGVVWSKGTVDNSTTWTILHVVATDTQVVLFYSSPSAQKLNFAIINPTGASIIGGSTVFKSGANVFATGAPFDVSPLTSTDVIIVWADNTPNIQCARFTPSTATTVATATISTENPSVSIACIATLGEFGVATYYSAVAAAFRGVCFNSSTCAQTVAPFNVENVASTFGHSGLVRFDSTHVMCVWGREAVGIVKAFTQWATIDTTGAVGSITKINNVDVVTKPFTYGGQFYANLYAKYTAQQTYFTVNLTSISVAAMHGYRNAWTSSGSTRTCVEVDNPTAGKFYFNLPIAYKFLSSATARAGASSFGCDFASAKRALFAEGNQSTYFIGGVGQKLDGKQVVEANFVLYPEITGATPGAVGASGMDNGTYSYIAVFEASDRNGNTDRSTTSIAVSATTVAGPGLGKVTLTIDHLTLSQVGITSSPNTMQGIVSIFRTTANTQATYYFIGSVRMDRTASNFTYVDQANDSTIGANRVLYTAGGVLDREPPLPSLQMVVHHGRVFGISSADRKVVFYSGQFGPGEGVWFSSFQQFRVEPGGDITALASLDDKLVIWKSDRIFKIIGDGVNALGQNSSLSDPALISGDAGCGDPRSLVTTPDGVMFQSPKGMYMISRAEQVMYAGQAADRYWASYTNVVAANMLPDRREVRFELSGPIPPLATPLGQKVVLNYQDAKWTTHRNYLDAAAASAVVVNGVYYWATAGGHVYAENNGFLDPNSTYIPSTLETGWIQAAGPQGFCRYGRVVLLNDWRADHGLEMQVAKDYSLAYTQSVAFSRTSLNALSLEQVSLHVSDQKGEAIRLRISDYADGVSPGEGFAARAALFYAKAIRGTFEKLLSAGARG